MNIYDDLFGMEGLTLGQWLWAISAVSIGAMIGCWLTGVWP